MQKTILSFHSLLTEKDKSITKFQDLLQAEKEQLKAISTKLNADIDKLKDNITALNLNIKEKDIEILELKHKLETVTIRKNSTEKLDLAVVETEDNVDNSLNELSDDKIEEMFECTTKGDDRVPKICITTCGEGAVVDNISNLKEASNFLKQIKDLKDKVAYWEKSFKAKEDEVQLLKDKYCHILMMSYLCADFNFVTD